MTERLRRILRRLPTWFKMRYDANTVGQQLLDALSRPLDAAEAEMVTVNQEFYLGTADPNKPTWVYRASIDAPASDESLEIQGNGFQLELVPDLLTFIRAWPNDSMYESTIYYANPCLYDHEYRMLYVRKPYGETVESPGGFIDVTFKRADGQSRVVRHQLELHHIWNSFDEFALLMGMARRYAELNGELRERIWDRFRYPRHAGAAGTTSRIAQSIGSTRTRIWEKPSSMLTIPEPHVMPELIVVNGHPLKNDQYQIDSGDRVVLLPRTDAGPLTVRYLVGILVRAATPLDVAQNRYDVESVTPRWGYMRYDVSFWMPEAMSSVRVPVQYDSDLSVWQ